MLFQKNQKKISSILRNIYKPSLNEKDIDFASIGDNTFLKQGNSINKINILFNKIEKKND